MRVQSTGSNYVSGAQKTEQVLKKTNRELQKILERLSTGSRINRASDDAAGLAISEQLRSRIRGFKTASENVESSMSALGIADGVGNEISSLLGRQRELALQARNSTLNDTNRKALDKEYQALSSEIERIAGAAQYNRQGVSAGEELGSGEARIQVGAESTDQLTFPQIDFRSAAHALNGTSIATAEGAMAALDTLDSTIQSVNSQRSSVGAAVNRLQSAVNNLSMAVINTQAAESVLRDGEMASSLAQLTRERLLQEGSTRAFNRFNEITQNHIMGLLG